MCWCTWSRRRRAGRQANRVMCSSNHRFAFRSEPFRPYRSRSKYTQCNRCQFPTPAFITPSQAKLAWPQSASGKGLRFLGSGTNLRQLLHLPRRVPQSHRVYEFDARLLGRARQAWRPQLVSTELVALLALRHALRIHLCAADSRRNARLGRLPVTLFVMGWRLTRAPGDAFAAALACSPTAPMRLLPREAEFSRKHI